MLDNERGSTPLNNRALGDNFAAQSSPSYGGELGRSFEDHNSSREEWEKDKHRGRRALIWGALLAVLVIASLAIYFTTRPKAGEGSDQASTPAKRGRGQSGPAAITVGESTTGDSNVYVNALGTVTPLHTVTLYSQVTGRVLSVHYTEGQLVHKGQVLVEIDPRPYEAALAQAKGTLTHDENVLAEARMDLKRYQDALARNAVSRQQVEDQEKLVLQDEGTVATDQGSLLSAQTNLSYCHISSPINGRVGLRLVDPGNTVFSGTGSTLVVITELQPITVVFTVSEDNLPQIQQQMHGGKSLAVDAFDRTNDNILASGKLTSLDNQIDTTTGTLKFRAAFDNKNLAMFPNQFVNARLLVSTLHGATIVPTSAVQYNGLQAFVYIVKVGASHKKNSGGTPAAPTAGTTPGTKGATGTPATVSVQNITILTSNETSSAVSGIGAGTKLATSGFDRLENNADALIQPSQPANGQGGHGKSSGKTSTGAPGSQTTSPAGGN